MKQMAFDVKLPYDTTDPTKLHFTINADCSAVFLLSLIIR